MSRDVLSLIGETMQLSNLKLKEIIDYESQKLAAQDRKHRDRMKNREPDMALDIYFEDSPRTYRSILEVVAEANYDIVASSSQTLIQGEIAHARIRVRDLGMADSDAQARIEDEIREALGWKAKVKLDKA
jgi:hypothetical protein